MSFTSRNMHLIAPSQVIQKHAVAAGSEGDGFSKLLSRPFLAFFLLMEPMQAFSGKEKLKTTLYCCYI